MKIYHTETQADYDALMVELESNGCKWASGDGMTELTKNWKRHSSKTCVSVDKKVVMYDKKRFYARGYPEVPIQKYKAKADEKMKFTKENVEKVVNEYFGQSFDKFMQDGGSFADLKEKLINLVDEPEKAVVPKCFDEWYQEIKGYWKSDSIAKKFALWKLCQQGFGHSFEDVRGREISYASDLARWLRKNKMLAIDAILNGYTIEREPLYVIPLENLVTIDGVQQYLSYDATGENYFASRPRVELKQEYTKDELQDVPEGYKAFAVPVEVEK